MTNILAILATSLVTNVTTTDNAVPEGWKMHGFTMERQSPIPATEKTDTFQVNEITELVTNFEGKEVRQLLKTQHFKSWEVRYKLASWIPVSTNEILKLSTDSIVITNIIGK